MGDKIAFETVEKGGVTSPKGFLAAGAKAGLKRSGALDFGLVVSEVPAVAAGAFTTNLFAAAPVIVCRRRLAAGGRFRAIVVNSGNANAATGERGERDAEAMAGLAAEALKVPMESVLVASTGRIGVSMPMDLIAKGAKEAAAATRRDGGADFARAIMTTDTRPKEIAVSYAFGGKTVTIGGACKGAGMIAPKMAVPHATMLAFLTTDAAASADFLRQAVATVVEKTFNRITIDGDTSTNDSVFLLANGLAGNATLTDLNGADGQAFVQALEKVMTFLAMELVRDGEGVTKFVTIDVKNAATKEDALRCARAIADSLLCKTAWFGNDPNWGRIACAAGYSGATFDAEKVNVYYNDRPAILKGRASAVPENELADELRKNAFTLTVDLAAGSCSERMWTNDITYDYVKINADYHT